MTGEVNRVPLGLLSLLDMTARGQVPRTLEPAVGGSLELRDLYLANTRIRRGSAITVNTVGHITAFTVPENELWWVHAFTCHSTSILAAATELIWTAGCRVRIEGGGTQQPQTLGPTSPRFLAGDYAVAHMDKDYYLAMPGDLLGPIVTDLVVGTNPAAACVLDFTRLLI